MSVPHSLRYVKFAFDTDDSRNVVLKFFEAREPWELEARVLVGLSRIFERGQTHSDGEGGGDSLHAAPRLLERIDLSGPRSFTPLPYVLVLEEGNRAPLVATQDSELERVAVVSRLLRCVRLLHEAPRELETLPRHFLDALPPARGASPARPREREMYMCIAAAGRRTGPGHARTPSSRA